MPDRRFRGRGGDKEDLVEWNYGAYEGRTTGDIRKDHPGWLLWRDGAPGGERPADVTRRIDRVVEELLATCAHGTLGWKREIRVLETWNDRGHLPREA